MKELKKWKIVAERSGGRRSTFFGNDVEKLLKKAEGKYGVYGASYCFYELSKGKHKRYIPRGC